jgi:hypothetical protein
LGELRAAIAYGADQTLRTNIELATWTRRLAHEVGAFEALPIDLPALPQDVGATVRAVRHGFALLVGLRWADYEPRPVAFAVRFAAAWCSVSHRDSHLAIRALKDRSVIHEADRRGRIPLYLPGEAV